MYQLIKIMLVMVMMCSLFGCDNSVSTKNETAPKNQDKSQSTACSDDEVTTSSSPLNSVVVKGCALNE